MPEGTWTLRSAMHAMGSVTDSLELVPAGGKEKGLHDRQHYSAFGGPAFHAVIGPPGFHPAVW